MFSELLPIILAAGSGSRMDQLLGSSMIKCLLPIRNHPLIFYPLKFLAQNGFIGKEVLVVVQEEEKEDIRRSVDKIGDKLGLKVDYFSVTADENEEDFGTCQSLVQVYNARKILKDILLISCDTVTNADFAKFYQFHTVNNSDVTALFLPNLTSNSTAAAIKVHGPKSKIKQERDIIGIDPASSALVFLGGEADFEDSISLPLSTIRKCPHVKLLTNLTDAHIYIIKKKVFDLGSGKAESLQLQAHSSLKGEFIPYLINSKYADDEHEQPSASAASEAKKLSFYAYIDRSRQCVRVNTITSYSIINKLNDWLHKAFAIGLIPSKEDIDSKIGAGVKLVGGSLIGDLCTVGDKSKLTNTILMDDVEVGEGSVLDNCIAASGARIGAKCVLKECLIGPKYIVASNNQFTNEYLTSMDETFFES